MMMMMMQVRKTLKTVPGGCCVCRRLQYQTALRVAMNWICDWQLQFSYKNIKTCLTFQKMEKKWKGAGGGEGGDGLYFASFSQYAWCRLPSWFNISSSMLVCGNLAFIRESVLCAVFNVSPACLPLPPPPPLHTFGHPEYRWAPPCCI